MICYRFYFLKAMNGQLVVPNVEPLHEWTGDKIRDIAGQGDLYIRTTYPLCLELPQVRDIKILATINSGL